jgi:hypothetical protein
MAGNHAVLFSFTTWISNADVLIREESIGRG